MPNGCPIARGAIVGGAPRVRLGEAVADVERAQVGFDRRPTNHTPIDGGLGAKPRFERQRPRSCRALHGDSGHCKPDRCAAVGVVPVERVADLRRRASGGDGRGKNGPSGFALRRIETPAGRRWPRRACRSRHTARRRIRLRNTRWARSSETRGNRYGPGFASADRAEPRGPLSLRVPAIRTRAWRCGRESRGELHTESSDAGGDRRTTAHSTRRASGAAVISARVS